MANTIWKEVFLIMCSSSWENARNTERFPQSLRITDDYALQTLCGEQHKICDDEGKINGGRPNRAIYGEDGKMMDIICGKFFICDCSTSSFKSLPDDMMEKYKKQFLLPERFCRINGEILAVKFDPAREEAR